MRPHEQSSREPMPPLYVGTWHLVPELSLYALGTPPVSGTYEISQSRDGVSFRVRWRLDGDEADRSSEFGGKTDGSRIALPASGGPDSFSIEAVDDRTLDSSAFRGEKRVAWARRVASADGDLLAVVQEAAGPQGELLRNFQVYRRADR